MDQVCCKGMDDSRVAEYFVENVKHRLKKAEMEAQIAKVVLPIIQEWDGKKITQHLKNKVEKAIREAFGDVFTMHLSVDDYSSTLSVWKQNMYTDRISFYLSTDSLGSKVLSWERFVESNKWYVNADERVAKLVSMAADQSLIDSVAKEVVRVSEECEALRSSLNDSGAGEFFNIDLSPISVYTADNKYAR